MPFPVTLGTPAPPAGVLLTLTSSKTLTLTVSPASVFIPGGSTTPTTQPQVTGVNIGVATITASAPGYTPASQAVPVPATISFSPANLTITGPGSTAKLLIALSDSAPWGTGVQSLGKWLNDPPQLLQSRHCEGSPLCRSVPGRQLIYHRCRGGHRRGPGTATIRVGAPPFIPEISSTVTVSQ